MKRLFLLSAWLISSAIVHGQKSSVPFEDHFINLRGSFIAQNAYETVKFVEPRWRLAGNSGFNESIFYVEKKKENTLLRVFLVCKELLVKFCAASRRGLAENILC